MVNKRAIGKGYEELAARYLKDNGYVIKELNFCCKYGEIDIIAKEGNTLVFVEVKYRSNAKYGMPFEAVNYSKQNKIIMTAEYYRIKHDISDSISCRFDVVSILGDYIEVIKDAFGGWK